MAAEGEILDVVIVGAGLSGLTAAHEILKIAPMTSIVVVEAKNRVGGRTLTNWIDTGNGRHEKFDFGGQWVSHSQPDIMELLEELGLSTYKQFISGTKVMQVGRDNKVRTYTSEIPALGSWWGLIETQLFIWKVERLCKQIPVEDPYQWSLAAEYDAMTMETFVRRNLKTEAAVDMIQAACRASIGTDLARVSAFFFLFYAAAAGGVMRLLMATQNGAQELRVKGGTQQISELLTEKIGGNKIYLERAVTRIVQWEEDGGGLTIYTATGAPFRARHAIVTIPPQFVTRIDFQPPLPPNRRLLMENMPMGHLIKFVITYDQAYWRDAGYSGEVVSNGGDRLLPGCSSGPISIVYDATTDSGVAALVGFIAGQHATEWKAKTEKERKTAVLLSLTQCLGMWAAQPTSYTEKDWSEEDYVGGCPVSFGVPGIAFSFHALQQPHGRISWAGTETSNHWTGYLSGAVQSGRRAACEVLTSKESPNAGDLRRLVRRRASGSFAVPNVLSQLVAPLLALVVAVLAVSIFYLN